MKEGKKAWVTPELIVLVRSKPEEAVLVVCKAGTTLLGAGGNYATGCAWGGASDCFVQAPS